MWMRRGVSGGGSVCSRREGFGARKVGIRLGRSEGRVRLGEFEEACVQMDEVGVMIKRT